MKIRMKNVIYVKLNPKGMPFEVLSNFQVIYITY